MRILLIDDTRDETNVKRRVDLIARNYWSGILALEKLGPWDLVFLDHDLNTFYPDGKELTGYDIVKFLEQNPHLLPADVQLVSSNPPGRARMGQVLSKLYGRDIR